MPVLGSFSLLLTLQEAHRSSRMTDLPVRMKLRLVAISIRVFVIPVGGPDAAVYVFMFYKYVL